VEAAKPGAIKSLAIATVTLAVAWQSYSFALIPNLRRSAPEVVLNRNPSDAVALSKTIASKVKESGQYVTHPKDGKAAAQSLIDTPLSRSSLRILGFDHVRQGDKVSAARIMSMSNRVSRRDTWAQIWLLEEAARAENFGAILSHFHAALSVKPELAPALNPILVSATRFPEVRLALRPYLRQNAPWASGYLSEASAKAGISDVSEAVLPVAHHLAGDAYVPAMSQIIYRLAADGRLDEAMSLADTVWHDFDRQAFGGFAPEIVNSDPRMGKLAWGYSNEGGISSRLAGEGTIEVTFSPLSRGLAVSRTVPLKRAGNYFFTQRVELTGSSPPGQLRWQAQCISSAAQEGAEIMWQQALPLTKDVATYRSTVAVPEGCNLLMLSLFGTGPERQTEAAVILSDMQLERM